MGESVHSGGQGPATPVILSVDDQEGSRYVRNRILTAAGFDIIEAADGAEALNLAAERQPSLIVLDIRLPDISGFEVCRRLKSDPRTQAIPVLHVSALGRMENDLPEALEHSSDAYLREPIDAETLVGTARALIRVREAERRQHEAEERARQVERQAAGILESLADPVAAFDKQWRCTYVSRRAAEILGKAPEEMIGKSMWELFPEDIETGFQEACRRAWAENKPVTVERYSNVLDVWVESYIYPSENGATTQWRDITDRKRAEEALRESERRYSALFANKINAIGHCRVITGAGGKPVDFEVLQVNAAYELVTGMRKAEIEGRRIRDVFPGIENLSFDHIGNYGKIALEGGELSREVFFEPLKRWLSVYVYSPERGEFVAIVTDITGRKQAEQALRTSEARLSTALDHLGEGVLIATEAGEIFYWNPAARAMHGFTAPDEGCGPIKDLLHDFQLWTADGRRMLPLEEWPMFRIVRGETVRNLELRLRCPGRGWERFISHSGAMLETASGERLVYLSIYDLTEQRRAEQALRDSEQRYRALFESMQEGFAVGEVICSASGEPVDWRYLDVNPAFESMFGCKHGEVVGRTFREVFPDAPWEYWVPGLGRVALTGTPAHLEHFGHDFGRHFEAIAYSPRPGQFAAIFTDVTARKRAEERLRQTQKLESIGLLAGGIAHDFNNLLTGIMGNASMVLDEIDAGPAERIREVIGSAEKAADLTRQLLAYSGKGRFVVRDVNVSEFVHEIGSLVEFSIPKGIELAVTVQRRLPAVRMDRSQLQQALMNLVINAGEAIGEGNPGKITVATSMTHLEEPFVDAVGEDVAPGRYVCIEVADTGIGLDEEKKSKLFDPFFTTKFTGRGLGLAAVAGIVRSHKGAITVDSTPGRGTTFRVFLPVAGAHARETSEQPATGRLGTVLVVDDEATIRDFIGAVLRKQGYRVLPAADGRDALAVYDRESGKIDALVLDVVMPFMGANELLPILKARRPELKILLTSGYSQSEARRLCAAYPGAAFIQKPYTAQQIAKAVDELLGVPRGAKIAAE